MITLLLLLGAWLGTSFALAPVLTSSRIDPTAYKWGYFVVLYAFLLPVFVLAIILWISNDRLANKFNHWLSYGAYKKTSSYSEPDGQDYFDTLMKQDKRKHP